MSVFLSIEENFGASFVVCCLPHLLNISSSFFFNTHVDKASKDSASGDFYLFSNQLLSTWPTSSLGNGLIRHIFLSNISLFFCFTAGAIIDMLICWYFGHWCHHFLSFHLFPRLSLCSVQPIPKLDHLSSLIFALNLLALYLSASSTLWNYNPVWNAKNPSFSFLMAGCLSVAGKQKSTPNHT